MVDIACVDVREQQGQDRKGTWLTVSKPEDLLDLFCREGERLSSLRHSALNFSTGEALRPVTHDGLAQVPQEGVETSSPDARDDERAHDPSAQRLAVLC